jgi:hypothetical protein
MHLKVFLKLEKKPYNPLFWAKKPQKKPKKPKKPKKTNKKPKKPKKPTGLAGFFQPCIVVLFPNKNINLSIKHCAAGFLFDRVSPYNIFT